LIVIADSMKAVVYDRYGPPEVLHVAEVEKPVPADDELLIRVHAVSLNASDWEALTGKPLYARIFGLFRPKFPILGSDISGTVEQTGANVSRFKPGDEVFGDLLGQFGGFGEYLCTSENRLLPKPPGLSFEEAAALPQGSAIALQAIRDVGKVKAGQKVLINGAGGSAGSFAIQLAKHFGAEVTTVDNGRKLEFMRSIGADHVIDYEQEEYPRNGERYDLILDLAAHHSIFDCRRSLAPGGVYLLVGGSMKRLLQALFIAPLLSIFDDRKLSILALKQLKGVDEIASLCTSGTLRPIIDRRFPLHEAADALRHLGRGDAKGKVVITMDGDEVS